MPKFSQRETVREMRESILDALKAFAGRLNGQALNHGKLEGSVENLLTQVNREHLETQLRIDRFVIEFCAFQNRGFFGRWAWVLFGR
jgi:hypothetical protein